jgi:hypothetical protein
LGDILALQKENDEVRLHSRFISVLPSPISRHGQIFTFLKLFFKTLSIENFDLVHTVENIPKKNIIVCILTLDGSLPPKESLGMYYKIILT